MPSLIAKTPLAGLWPETHGDLTLSEVALDRITSVAPFRGQEAALAKALKPLGLAFPAPGRFAEQGSATLVWTGRDQAFLIGATLETAAAALTDQSDGWACLRLEGPAAEVALARLVPLDLRAQAFPPGTVARTALGHINCILLRRAVAFEILVFRSMARSAWHDLREAMQRLAARAAVE